MNITLNPEMETLIEESIEAGTYHSASQMVNEGLRLLKIHSEFDALRLEALRRDIAHAVAQEERGEILSGEEVFKKLRERMEKARVTQ